VTSWKRKVEKTGRYDEYQSGTDRGRGGAMATERPGFDVT